MDERAKNCRPPTSNTGVVNTKTGVVEIQKEGLRACVDWFQATFFDCDIQKLTKDILEIPFEWFEEMEKGQNGYQFGIRFQNIKIFFGDKYNRMGINLHMSGQGCRDYEAYGGRPWVKMMKDVLTYGQFSRLDLAIDDFKGYYTVEQIQEKKEKGEVVSKFKTASDTGKHRLSDGQNLGRTCGFGSETSDLLVRFYDKKFEQEIHKKKEVLVDFWNRTELQLRRKKANAIAREIVGISEADADETAAIGLIIMKVLNNYIRFVEPPSSTGKKKKASDSNKSRWETSEWWAKFIGEVEKLSLSDKAPDKSIDKLIDYANKQFPKTLAMLYIANGGKLEFVEKLINAGLERLGENEIATALEHYEEIEMSRTKRDFQKRFQKVRHMWFGMPMEERAKYGTVWKLYNYMYENE